MKEANAQLLAFLETTIEGLVLSSEAEYPYTVSIWEVSERGEFSVMALLLSIGYLTVVEPPSIFEDIGTQLAELEQNEEIQFNRLYGFANSIVPKQQGGPSFSEVDLEYLTQLVGSDNADIYSESLMMLAEQLERFKEKQKQSFSQPLSSEIPEAEPKIKADSQEAEEFRAIILERLTASRQICSEIVAAVEPYLHLLKVFRLSTRDLVFQRVYGIHIVTGQLNESQWIGFSTRLPEILHKEDDPLPVQPGRDVEAISSEVQVVVSAFEEAVEGYAFPPMAPFYGSEIDKPSYPFESFIWEISTNESSLVQQLLETMRFLQILSPISDEDYDYLIHAPWNQEDSETEREEVYSQKIASTIDFIKHNLTEQKIYRLGLVEIDVYTVGKTHDNDWIYFSSTAVET
ncbi:MAG TPA: hypothetical protein IGS53_27560 [Leptolyngbyaceae cyanobacterium M33_DOE_097]|uniref:Uncharacterized protein n=1 Tax=Oscillatoriales cyanobacterium SpSt-418 TaxID=2282169 RepID=A0A7C3KD65_9CYAN|nr:hypothetical protein [Leptolyngbyaceae cyanobacterium M33_DOE_097]